MKSVEKNFKCSGLTPRADLSSADISGASTATNTPTLVSCSPCSALSPLIRSQPSGTCAAVGGDISGSTAVAAEAARGLVAHCAHMRAQPAVMGPVVVMSMYVQAHQLLNRRRRGVMQASTLTRSASVSVSVSLSLSRARSLARARALSQTRQLLSRRRRGVMQTHTTLSEKTISSQ